MDEHVKASETDQSPQSSAIAHLERLLALLLEGLPDGEDTAGREALSARIDQYRRALVRRDVTAIRASGEALLNVCRETSDSHVQLRAVRRAEMADLVSVFRDMTITVTGEDTSLTADMSTAAARFAALGSISDLRLLKQRLAQEVDRLKEATRQREGKWQSLVNGFRQQVAVLEAELVATRQEASLDSLTGVANRGLFDRRLREYTGDDARCFALVLVDVDDFKRINDQQGHEAGDGVLQVIADTMSTSVRNEDLVARIGGDEFALVLQNVTLSQASARCTSVIAAITSALEKAGYPPASISCGVAAFAPGDAPQTLMKRADEALYESKRRGAGLVSEMIAPVTQDAHR